MQSLIENFTSECCREALGQFWDSACSIQQDSPHAMAIAMPLLLVDGWQVVVYIEEERPGIITLRDCGNLSTLLYMNGINRGNAYIKSSITSAMQNFAVHEDSKGFYKRLRLPMEAKEVHLFASFLSSVSHLAWRAKKEIEQQYPTWTLVAHAIDACNFQCEQRRKYSTPLRDITVELSAHGENKSSLFQTFDQKQRLNTQMELWAHRMKEISDFHGDTVQTALVYNENAQPDSDILNLANKFCDLVCPSDKEDEIRGFIMKAA